MEEINIRDFLNYLKKYVLVIVVVAIVLIIGVFIYDKSIKKPLYTTYTTIILTKSNETQTGTTITQNDILLNQTYGSELGTLPTCSRTGYIRNRGYLYCRRIK